MQEGEGKPKIIEISDDEEEQQVSEAFPLARIFPCGIWEIMSPEGIMPGVAEWVGARIAVEQHVIGGRFWLKTALGKWIDMGFDLASRPPVIVAEGGRNGRMREAARRKTAGVGEGGGDSSSGSAGMSKEEFWDMFDAFERDCARGRRATSTQEGQVGGERAEKGKKMDESSEDEFEEWMESVTQTWNTRGQQTDEDRETNVEEEQVYEPARNSVPCNSNVNEVPVQAWEEEWMERVEHTVQWREGEVGRWQEAGKEQHCRSEAAELQKAEQGDEQKDSMSACESENTEVIVQDSDNTVVIDYLMEDDEVDQGWLAREELGSEGEVKAEEEELEKRQEELAEHTGYGR